MIYLRMNETDLWIRMKKYLFTGTSIFNLAGQRLQKPQRGLNIINDKKVVVVE